MSKHPDLLTSADIRLRDWGVWLAIGNSLSGMQPKSCLRPDKSVATAQAENPHADAVHKALINNFNVNLFAIITAIYVRRMSQREVAKYMGCNLSIVQRTARKAKIIVIAECI